MYGYMLLLIWVIGWVQIADSKRLFHKGDPKKRYAVAASAGVILLSGLRSWRVGPDSDSYMSYLENIHKGIYLNGYDRFEKGFEWFTKLIAHFTDNYTVYFMIIACVIMVLLGVFLYKASNNYFLSMFLYITIGTFIFQLTGLRQAIAMAICSFSVIFVHDKKWIPFFLCVALAAQFHKSAWVFAPLCVVGNMKPSVKTFVLMIIGVLAVLYANELITEKSNEILGYEKGYEEADGGYINIILYLGAIIASVSQYKNMFSEKSAKQEYNIIALNMSIITFITYIMRYWLRMSERVSKYYQVGIVILLVNFISSIKDKNSRYIVVAIAMMLAFALFVYRNSKLNSQYIYYFFWQ